MFKELLIYILFPELPIAWWSGRELTRGKRRISSKVNRSSFEIQKSQYLNKWSCIQAIVISSMFMQCSGLVNVIRAKVGSLETSFLLLRYTQASHYNGPKCLFKFSSCLMSIISCLVWVSKVSSLFLVPMTRSSQLSRIALILRLRR